MREVGERESAKQKKKKIKKINESERERKRDCFPLNKGNFPLTYFLMLPNIRKYGKLYLYKNFHQNK